MRLAKTLLRIFFFILFLLLVLPIGFESFRAAETSENILNEIFESGVSRPHPLELSPTHNLLVYDAADKKRVIRAVWERQRVGTDSDYNIAAFAREQLHNDFGGIGTKSPEHTLAMDLLAFNSPPAKGVPWAPLLLLDDDTVLTVSIGADTTDGTVPLTVRFSIDNVSEGIPPYTYSWDLDGDGIEDETNETPLFVYTESGTYRVTLKITDSIGAEANDTTSISAEDTPAVKATAIPTAGPAPLDVNFACSAIDPDGTIALFEWDFNGDGAYDWNSAQTCAASHTYIAPGLYSATVRVTDDDQWTATDAVNIPVGAPPAVDASVKDATTGQAPFTVEFIGTGSDTDGNLVLFEWDFDGDGVYDWSSTVTGNTSYTYTYPGAYGANLRVRDNDGLTNIDTVLIVVAGPPLALPRAHPTRGGVPLTVTFFSDGDDSDGSPEYFDWDFDGDGTYDQRLVASMNVTHTFNEIGTYHSILRVTDNEGFTGTGAIAITVTGNGYPTAVATANPTNGGAPLQVTFMGSGTDPDGNITKYEWDFDGDGLYDWEEPAQPGGPIGFLIDVGTDSSPVFADIDNDGDMDLFVGGYSGNIDFYRNEGPGTSTGWATMGFVTETDGTMLDVGSESSPAFADIDSDGDMDLFVGGSGGEIDFFRNDGTSSEPDWTPMGPVKDAAGTTLDVDLYSSPVFTDIDNDGDVDLFLGEWRGRILYYRNDGTGTTPIWTPLGFVTDADTTTIDVGYDSQPVFADIDSDGDEDLFVGGSGGQIAYYRNDGSDTLPIWTSMGFANDADGSALDVASDSSPVLVDVDNDGDLDLFVGESSGKIFYYRNQGDASAPVWNLANARFNYIGADNASAPAFTDIGNDGDMDLFVGDSRGQITFYRNDGTKHSPEWTAVGLVSDADGSTVDVGTDSIPVLTDIDNDGDVDLFVGQYDGQINYYRNDGSNNAPVWTSLGLVIDADGTTLDVGFDSSPTFGDIDSDGDVDLFVGQYGGRINYYRNDGSSSAPVWSSQGYVTDAVGNTLDVGYYSSPVFTDIDKDGDLDLFVGEYENGIHYYRNDGDAGSPSWTDVSPNYNSQDPEQYSKPAFVDIDNDGDDDLFVGDDFGQIVVYPTVGYVTYTYTAPGTYNATLRVTDNDGFVDTDSVNIRLYGSGSPSAKAYASPTTGVVPLLVSFTGTGTDPDGSIVFYEWDFDGDGTYDWSSSHTEVTSHTYNNAGTFVADLRVTDNDGQTATDSVIVKSTLGISTTRTGLFNPFAGETGDISSSITDDAIITIRVMDSSGNIIRTLLSNISRSPGNYTDTWDGNDDFGQLVEDGVYYFLIEYTVNGETSTYDLRQTAEYEEITPSRTWPSTFNPYEEKFIEISYTLPKPAEVSIYFWTRGPGFGEESIVPVRTLFVREPRGAGSHTEIWEGIDDKGAVVEPGKEYAITLWAYELPDNAIIISGGTGGRPEVTDVAAAPNYLNPTYNPYGSTPTQSTIVTFKLQKPADLEARIVNSAGVLMKTIFKKGLPAGPNMFTWNGKDFAGNIVQDGSYSISLTAIDIDGNRSLPRYAAVIVYY